MKASDVLNQARAEVDTREYPPGSNRTKYGAWYGMNGQPWCAIFVTWVFRNNLSLIGGKHAYTPTFARWFKDVGKWGTKPRIGAIAFFDFPDNVNRIQHVGIVENIGNGTVTTIEGNTSSGISGSQSNGGGVYRRVRPLSLIVGFGYPAYAPEAVWRTARATFGIREHSRLLSRIVGKLHIGDRVRVTDVHGAWSLICFGGKWGWVPTSKLG